MRRVYERMLGSWNLGISSPGGTCAGFRDRVLGNPRFLVVLAIELVMGLTGKWSAEVQARGDKFWQARAGPASQECPRDARCGAAALHALACSEHGPWAR